MMSIHAPGRGVYIAATESFVLMRDACLYKLIRYMAIKHINLIWNWR